MTSSSPNPESTTTSSFERVNFIPLYEAIRCFVGSDRMYNTPDGLLPGVTTVLSGSRDESGLEIWRESIGIERADFIRDLACFRGTGHHLNTEEFFKTGKEPEFDFLLTPYWKSSRPFLDRIDKPLLQEGAVWHKDGYAGTFDCIAYLKEDPMCPVLLDWKTADAPRKPDKVYEYSLQLAAYVNAINYVYKTHGLVVKKAMLVVAIADCEAQIETFDEDALNQLYLHFRARLQRYTFSRSKKK